MKILTSDQVHLKSPAGNLISSHIYSLDSLLNFLDLGFTKYAYNPILPKRAGEWDAFGTRELTPVISDTTGEIVTHSDGKIWAYYWGRPTASGTLSIGIAKSNNGGYTWIDRPTTPVISPSGVGGSWYESGIHTPAVIQRQSDGLFMMLASGITPSDTRSLGVLTSSDGITWADGGQKLTNSQFSWDGITGVIRIAVPTAIRRMSGDYLALFECFKSGGAGGQWRIFGATSPNFTGTWTPLNGGLPIFQELSGWESNGVANPRIIEIENGLYLLAYNGNDGGGTIDWEIGFAYSDDLSTWTRYGGNPVLSKSVSGWDNLLVETSFLVKEKTNHFRLYYQGFTTVDESHQVGLAIAK